MPSFYKCFCHFSSPFAAGLSQNPLSLSLNPPKYFAIFKKILAKNPSYRPLETKTA
jgi:hypothetical protein